jgi:hypothetical protein
MSEYTVILENGQVKHFKNCNSARSYARENGGKVRIGYIRNENQTESPSLAAEWQGESGQKASDLILRPY